MRLRICLAALVASAFAVTAMALTGEYLDWGNGPAQFLMSREESVRWKSLRTDEDAASFIALFWARRDPTPETPRNEFREEFEARVAWADKNLEAGERLRGSLTDRGRMFVLFGPPKRILRSAAERTAPLLDAGRELQDIQRETRDWIEWIYEDSPSVKAIFGVPRASIRFVDRFNTNEFKLERGSIDIAAATQRAIRAGMTRPDLISPPQFAAAPAPAAAAPALAVTPAPALTSAALLAAVSSFRPVDGKPGTQPSIAWGEYVTGSGTAYVPVLFFLPRGTAFQGGQEVTFFGVLRDADGKNAATFEETAKLVESKGDLFVDHSFVALPAGRYDGVFGIAEGGRPVMMASSVLELAGAGDHTTPGISPLILSNNLYPLTESWLPTAPFVFGGLKVVPKADRTFRASDDLWFFVELRNPGLTDRVLPDGVVPVAGTVGQSPVIQVKLEAEGVDAEGQKVRRASPPREVQPVAINGVRGHYGLGDAIPLASFKPGSYTLSVKIIDTVSKKSYSLTEKFQVVE